MSLAHGVLERRVAAGWGIVIVAACVVFFAGISHEALWYDEVVSVALANHSLSDIIRLMPTENHPPLHFLLLHFARVCLGNSDCAMRSLSALGAVGLVGLGAGPVRRLLGDRTAFVYASVVLVMPVVLIYAHEARMYSLACFAVTAAVLYGALAVTFGRLRDWVSFGLATLFAAYLHYYGLIAGAVTHLLITAYVLLRKREQSKRCLVTSAVTLAGYVPWLVVVAGQTARVNRTKFWVPPVTGHSVLEALFRPFAYRELGPTPPVVRPWMAAAFVLSMILIAAGQALARRRRAQLEQRFGMLLLGVYLGTCFLAIAVSLVSVPVFYSRYMTVCSGLVALLVSIGVGQLRDRWLVSVLATLTALNLLTLKDLYTRCFNPPFRQVQRALAGEIKPGDLLVTSDCFTVGPSLHYFPQAVTYYASNSFDGSRDEILTAMSPPLRYNDGLNDLLATRQTFWSFTDNTGLGRDIEDILADVPGWEASGEPRMFTQPQPYSFIGFAVTKYVHTGRQGPREGHGNIKVRVTGLRPQGYLMVMLFDRSPVNDVPPVRKQMFSLSSDRLDTTVYGVAHGEYVLLIWHDENRNFRPDQKEGRPAEGIWIANSDKVDPKLGLQGLAFNALKFPFHEAERRFDAPMQYPSF
ncbi:MAG TPA: glycosyltransferase family 39 protein [Polyangiaceae bacterium]